MILVPTSNADDWRRLLADPQTQWRRGYSAMATALSWEAAAGLPKEVSAIIGGEPDLLFAIPEHKVALPGGGRASQCDVFALVRAGDQTVALAVEAKVDEPFGPTVDEWLQGASDGKTTRIRYICQLLGLPQRPKTGLRYQLFHRTAAAVIEAERFKADRAAMIVQSFSQQHKWFEDFHEFAGQFGLDAQPGAALNCRLPSGMNLTLGWAVGSEEFL